MGDSMKNRKRNARIAEIETSRTSFSSKNTKTIGSVDFELKNLFFFEKSTEKEISPETSLGSGGVYSAAVGEQCSSFCSDFSSNESCEIVKDSLRFVDLEAKSFETEISTCINNKFSRETTPSSEICGDSKEMDSPVKNLTVPARAQPRKSPASKMPSQADIDDFFSVAEKFEQKRFIEKYNYDIVKDSPLEGRYQWVRLKP